MVDSISKRFFTTICIFLAAFLCFAKSSKMPDWVTDYRTIYPDSEYIVQRGRADTEETSRTEAIAQIARYFQTSVNANLKTRIQSVSRGQNVNEITTVVNDVDVMSQVDLFVTECTDPYYNKKEKKWYCLAYINRENAWIQYSPTVDGAKSEFYAMYKNAEKETDPFSKCIAYGKAWKSGIQFLEKLEYARILNPKKEAAYSTDRTAVSEIPSLILQEQQNCRIYLSVSGDYGNIISSVITEVFSKNGFMISKSSGGTNYTAQIFVESNAQGSDPVSIFPSLDLKITSKDGRTVFSNQTKIQSKTVAYTLENAQKKAFPILADEADKSISEQLSKLFGFK